MATIIVFTNEAAAIDTKLAIDDASQIGGEGNVTQSICDVLKRQGFDTWWIHKDLVLENSGTRTTDVTIAIALKEAEHVLVCSEQTKTDQELAEEGWWG